MGLKNDNQIRRPNIKYNIINMAGTATTHFREQIELRKKVVTVDCVPWSEPDRDREFSALKLIGGVDISFPKGDTKHACACLVVLSFPELKVKPTSQ